MECIMTKQCKACGTAFQPHPKVQNQTYCSSPECQRERRRRWQQKKRRDDADYRDNDVRARGMRERIGMSWDQLLPQRSKYEPP